MSSLSAVRLALYLVFHLGVTPYRRVWRQKLCPLEKCYNRHSHNWLDELICTNAIQVDVHTQEISVLLICFIGPSRVLNFHVLSHSEHPAFVNGSAVLSRRDKALVAGF